jgi:hypothetical protein
MDLLDNEVMESANLNDNNNNNTTENSNSSSAINDKEAEHMRVLQEMIERTDQGRDVCQFYLESAEWNLEKAIEILNQYIVN